jgi:hypothetical protein
LDCLFCRIVRSELDAVAPAGGFALLVERARQLFPIVVTLLLFLLLAAGLASTYVGNSRSPYNGCVGANGRAVSCAVLEAIQ